MKSLISYSVVIVSLLLTGCLRTYYPVAYHTSAAPMVLKNSESAGNAARYFSIDAAYSKGGYDEENLQVLRGSYLIVDTRDYFNFNTKLFGYGGNYTVSGVQGYNGPKSVFGLGGEAGLNLNFKIEGLKIGLGIMGGVGLEFGDYYRFQINAQREGLIRGYDTPVFFTFSAFPLIAYEFSESTVISTQVNLGLPGFISPSITLNDKGNVYWVSFLPDAADRTKIVGRVQVGFMMDIRKFGVNL